MSSVPRRVPLTTQWKRATLFYEKKQKNKPIPEIFSPRWAWCLVGNFQFHTNARIGILGKADDETDAAWLDYIGLLDTEPIVCNDRSLSIMNRIIMLCEKNRSDLEIILYTKDMTESCEYVANFIGFDVAGTYYSSILPSSEWHHMPEEYAKNINKHGLFDTFDQASEIAQYANLMTASEIEPEQPFAPVKVYILSK